MLTEPGFVELDAAVVVNESIPVTAPAPAQDSARLSARVLRRPLVLLRVAGVIGAAVVGASSMDVSVSAIAGARGGTLIGHHRSLVILMALAGLVRASIFLNRKPYARAQSASTTEQLIGQGVDAAIGTMVIATLVLLAGSHLTTQIPSLERSGLIPDFLLSVVGLCTLTLAGTAVQNGLHRNGIGLRRVVVVGSSVEANEFLRRSATRSTGYDVIAHMPDLPAPEQVLGRLMQMAANGNIPDEILFSPGTADANLLRHIRSFRSLTNVQLRALPELFGLSRGKAVGGPIMAGLATLTLLVEPLSPIGKAVKRATDILLASLAVLVTSPLILLTGVLVRVTSSGPVFFRQVRVGMDGRPFEMLKFRSMYKNADTKVHEDYVISLISGRVSRVEGEVDFFKLTNDPRVTPIGRIIRRLSIDELPQLFNVLRGNMSLVGPRPPLACEVAAYEEEHLRRLDVRPGITGLWQVSGRSRLTFEEMVSLDVSYLENWTPILDLRIIARTIPAVLRRDAS